MNNENKLPNSEPLPTESLKDSPSPGNQGFTPPTPRPRNWDNPPASRAVKERLKEGLMEVYYDLCAEFDKLARANQPLPSDIKISATVDLTERGRPAPKKRENQ